MKVFLKDFRRKISFYIEEMKKGEVFTVNNCKIGMVSNLLEGGTYNSLPENPKGFTANSEQGSVDTPLVEQDQIEESFTPCKCKDPAQYDDGDRFWCDDCVLKSVKGDYGKYKDSIHLMARI